MHRAIETRYKGRRFRSRLEARYAVLFDALDIVWDYEPEGFELSGGLRYLPDFRVAHPVDPHRVWVEIKPEDPTPVEKRKLELLVNQDESSFGMIFCGHPDRATVHSIFPGKPYLQAAPGIGIGLVVIPGALGLGPFDKVRWEHRKRGAINAALSARFEFGESGARA